MNNIRNQYVLLKKGYKEIIKPDNWINEEFIDYQLFVSPGLKSYKKSYNKVKYIFIGFAFSVLDSSCEMEDILGNLPDKFEAFIDYIDTLCGNFVIFREENNTLYVLNDAGGALKIFYYIEKDNILSAASDPALIKRFFPIEIDNSEQANEFYKSQHFNKPKIRLGNKTEFINVYQLLPNHLLNFKTARTRRFFPREPLEKLSPEESINKVHLYTSNVIDAAIRKYNLKCGLTAGWDSRMVLAATKKHKNKVEYYTFRKTGNKKEKTDINIARQIAKDLELKHQVIPVDNNISQEQLNLIRNNYSLIPMRKFDHIVNGFSKFKTDTTLVLLGVISEIAKNYYESVNIHNGKTLAKAAHFSPIKYVLSYQQQKFEELKTVCRKYNYNIRDLAHWEQDITNFAAQGIQYNSFMIKTLSPFNSRLIIKTLLASPRKLRDKHRHRYYKKYLQKFWPELNAYPVNPTFRKKMIVLGKITKIYGAYKLIVHNLTK